MPEMIDPTTFRHTGSKITNQDICFLLGTLIAQQNSTLELLKRHIEGEEKRWDHIERKTDRLQTIITWATGASVVIGTLLSLFVKKAWFNL